MRQYLLVLIVGLVLATIAGLLICGVAKVREAAGRIQCANNIKHIGLSIQNYQDQTGAYPRAALPNPELRPDERLSWIAAIVPWVESSPLYSRMAPRKSWDAEENRFAALMSYKIVQCPSYPYLERPPVSTLCPTHYVGITGIGTDSATLPLEDPRAGFFGLERKLTREDLRGRDSAIMMVVETARAHGTWIAAGPPTTRGLDPGDPPYVGRGGQYGGIHPGGVNVLFADGSIRFIAESIDPMEWEAMSSLNK